MAYISLVDVRILYCNVLEENTMQAISVCEPMNIVNECGNHILSKCYLEKKISVQICLWCTCRKNEHILSIKQKETS